MKFIWDEAKNKRNISDMALILWMQSGFSKALCLSDSIPERITAKIAGKESGGSMVGL
jgi:uncharacterized DUF497 family protein